MVRTVGSELIPFVFVFDVCLAQTSALDTGSTEKWPKPPDITLVCHCLHKDHENVYPT